MKKILPAIIIAIFSLPVFAQDKVTDELKVLSELEQFDKIIDQYAHVSKDYSAKSLYYIGHAYYMKENDSNCIRFMNLSIDKDAKDPAAHFIKALTLNYTGRYNDAIQSFQTAILLKPGDGEFYSGLGDAYYLLKKSDLALDAYNKATQQEKCSDRPYSMIAQIHSDLKEEDKALAAFYVATSKISKESDSYRNALFNIGVMEYLKSNTDKAEAALLELIQLTPDDYHAFAKLIQIYYQRKDYEKAKPYRDKLYEAHRKGALKDNLKEMFCFDQFNWNGYSVKVYERYENENKGRIYNKHIFYVADKADELVLRVQTEFSPVSVELGGPKYMLCANKGDTHYNGGVGFNDNFRYETLKTAAIKLMEKHID